MNLKLGDVGSSEGLEGLGGNMRKMYCHKNLNRKYLMI